MKSRRGFERFEKQVKAETPSHRKGQLLQVMETAKLATKDHIVPLLQGVELTTTDEQVALKALGKKLVFPHFCTEACAYLVNQSGQGAVSIDAIPGPLDDEGKLVLVRRLITEGLAEIAG